MPTVYVTIGNSDDKLGQADWATFRSATDDLIRRAAHEVHGAWVSPSADPWQNACWCFEITDDPDADYCKTRWLRGRLENLAGAYGQDSIAWARASNVEFLSGKAVPDA
uniref:hypothetical protein n=1 Tax=Paractinoplanes polyasparticus TaxID=2856853 RepID=UPI001C846234|nr:hypothetical protein [Actinoplanes polyasparticus]